MAKKPGFIRLRIKSFNHAFRGIKLTFQSQVNFKIQLIAAVIVTVLGFTFNISLSEWSVLILVFGMVLGAEAFNAAIEFLSDKVENSYDETIKKVKDIAAGAVLICSISALIIGVVIFLPKIF